MFGIFTHAEIRRKRYWDTLSQQLQQWGPEYIKRCTFRSEPLSAGDNVILPGLFPQFPYQIQVMPQAAPLVKVSEDYMKDVSDFARISTILTK